MKTKSKVSMTQRYLTCTIDQDARGSNLPTQNIVELTNKVK